LQIESCRIRKTTDAGFLRDIGNLFPLSMLLKWIEQPIQKKIAAI
jgi:hypothetical protein